MRARKAVPFLELLRERDYLLLLAGQLVSQLGDRLHEVALGVAIYKLTGSPNAVGRWTIAIILPNLLFGPVAGAFVDRWDKRRTMVFADLARAAIVALIPWALHGPLPFVYALTFLATTASLFFRPARTAVIPSIFPKEQFMAANSFALSVQNITDFLGYPLAGALTMILPVVAVFYLDSASFVVSAASVYLMLLKGLRAAEAPVRRSILREVADGLVFLRQTPVLLANFAVFTLGFLVCGGWNALIVVLALQVIKTSSFGYGLLNGAHGLGMVLGALALGAALGGLSARSKAIPKGLMVAAGFAVAGVFIALPAAVPLLPVGLVAFFFTGVGNVLFLVPSLSLMQELTPPELIGRVSSVRFSVAQVALMVSTLVLTQLAETHGAQAVILVDGLALAAVGALSLLIPAVRKA